MNAWFSYVNNESSNNNISLYNGTKESREASIQTSSSFKPASVAKACWLAAMSPISALASKTHFNPDPDGVTYTIMTRHFSLSGRIFCSNSSTGLSRWSKSHMIIPFTRAQS